VSYERCRDRFMNDERTWVSTGCYKSPHCTTLHYRVGVVRERDIEGRRQIGGKADGEW
jgi:hypothetical protein